LKRRLDSNTEYINLGKELRTLKDEIKEQEITLGYFKRKFRAAEAVSRIGVE